MSSSKKVYMRAPCPDNHKEDEELRLLRTAAYCRVSTKSEEQATSFQTQVNYFEKYIKANPAYIFSGIYADEGISGTSLKKREGFCKMIQDAREGKLDMIMTKSISRFGRNLTDSLSSIRELKSLHVDVFFEKENIHTESTSSEILFTLLMAIAENESVCQSENVKWGIQRKYETGDISSIPCGKFLGYNKVKGTLIIDEAEAEIVRRIYRSFLDGVGTYQIATMFSKEGVPMTFGGKEWCPSHLYRVLTNEKYMGDTLFLKTFNADPLTKRRIKNTGQREQYYAENTHPAIIDKATWLCVQLELQRQEQYCIDHRLHTYHRSCIKNPLSSRIVCSICGRTFNIVASNRIEDYGDKHWRCTSYYGKNGTEVPGQTFTPLPHHRSSTNPYIIKKRKDPKPRQMRCTDVLVNEGLPERAFIDAWNELIRHPGKLLDLKSDNVLINYRRIEMLRLLAEIGPLDSMPYALLWQTVARMEVCPTGDIDVIFLCFENTQT